MKRKNDPCDVIQSYDESYRGANIGTNQRKIERLLTEQRNERKESVQFPSVRVRVHARVKERERGREGERERERERERDGERETMTHTHIHVPQ